MANDEFFANGTIIDVMDGDTARLELSMGAGHPGIDGDGDGLIYIRFSGIDTPESKNRRWPAQPKSEEAKKFAEDLLLDKTVTARLKGDKTYGRAVGEIFVEGVSANRELVRNGFAWWNSKYEEFDLDYERLQDSARKKKLGIWADDDPIPPWEWRRNGGPK